jgi:hypothetical protein
MKNMNITLNAAQRINLQSALNMVRIPAGSPNGLMRQIWALQDKIAGRQTDGSIGLSTEEEKTIGFSVRIINGNEVPVFDYANALALEKTFEFTEIEAGHIKNALRSVDQEGRMRRWLKPLLDAFDPVEDTKKLNWSTPPDPELLPPPKSRAPRSLASKN